MGRKKKISDEQLRKELKNGNDLKTVAHEYGYGWPSSRLTTRVKNLGIRKLNKLNVMSHGSATLSIKKSQLQQIREIKEFQEDQDIFVERNVRSDGDMVLEFRQKPWVEDDV